MIVSKVAHKHVLNIINFNEPANIRWWRYIDFSNRKLSYRPDKSVVKSLQNRSERCRYQISDKVGKFDYVYIVYYDKSQNVRKS